MFVVASRTLFASLLAMLGVGGIAQGQAVGGGPLMVCRDDGHATTCHRTTIGEISLDEPVVHLRQVVDVPPVAAASPLPLAVTLVGTMSSEVRWNGAPVGSNGVVGPDAASETPGLFRVVMPVARDAVRPGRNVVDIRMSAHRRWLVRIPIQQLHVGLYAGPTGGELGAYWPALLTAGALLLAAPYFGTAAALGHAGRQAVILTAIAVAAVVQLAIETSRSFVDYAYPWHVVRISAIVGMVTLTSSLMVSYTARRFAPRRERLAVASSLAVSLIAIAVVQSFDAKAWIALFAAGLICLACAAHARRGRDGQVAMAVAVLFTVMLVWTSQDALDRGYYLSVAAVLGGLVAEQVVGQRRLHAGLAAERVRGDTLQERLAAAEATGDTIMSFRDGARIHRVPEREIIRITAADDFCELVLLGRKPVLIGGTLKSLGSELPKRFVRVHKSHVVNLAHVASVAPRPGGGHHVVHRDGSSTPIGRTYRDELVARML